MKTNQHTEDFYRLGDAVWTHFPGNGPSAGLSALDRVRLRLTSALDSQPDADPVRAFRAEAPKYAIWSLGNFLRSESFCNDERLAAICQAGYLRSALPALESPALSKEAS